MLLLKDLYGPFQGMNPGLVALEDCEGLFADLKTRKMVAEKCLGRR